MHGCLGSFPSTEGEKERRGKGEGRRGEEILTLLLKIYIGS